MRKKLDERHELLRCRFFPYTSKKADRFRNRALVAIGGNIADVPRRFRTVFRYMQALSSLHILRTSALLKNPPFGFIDQPDFYNAVMVIDTNLYPLALLHRLQRIEKRFGRKRSFANAPRTVDLDIILFENVFMYNRKLTLPHPRWQERTCVLMPMVWLNRVKKGNG